MVDSHSDNDSEPLTAERWIAQYAAVNIQIADVFGQAAAELGAAVRRAPVVPGKDTDESREIAENVNVSLSYLIEALQAGSEGRATEAADYLRRAAEQGGRSPGDAVS